MRYKRVVISRPGGPEVLQIREEELPEPGLVKDAPARAKEGEIER